MQKMYEIQEAYGCLGEEEKEDVMMREGKGNPHQMSEMLRMEPKNSFQIIRTTREYYIF